MSANSRVMTDTEADDDVETSTSSFLVNSTIVINNRLIYEIQTMRFIIWGAQKRLPSGYGLKADQKQKQNRLGERRLHCLSPIQAYKLLIKSGCILNGLVVL